MRRYGTRSHAHGRRFGVVAIAAVLLVALSASGAWRGQARQRDRHAGRARQPAVRQELERVKFVYPAWLPCVKAWKDGRRQRRRHVAGRDREHHQGRHPQAAGATTNTSRARSRTARPASSRPWRTRPRHASDVREGVRAMGSQVRGEVVEMSGSDEAAQRADAVAIAAMKPFAVIDLAAGDVFERHRHARRSCRSAAPDPTNRASNSRRIGGRRARLAANAVLGAEFVGKVLNGKPAEFAGDPALQSKKRVFGVVRSAGDDGARAQLAFDELKKRRREGRRGPHVHPADRHRRDRGVGPENAPT